MQIFQKKLTLARRKRGFHLITDEINTSLYRELPKIKSGIMFLFLQHTSASLTLNENSDPDVRSDFENFLSGVIDSKNYDHSFEGDDDMPAHLKSSLLSSNVTIPITKGRMALGDWQGIYLGEHKDNAKSRSIIVTILGE
jgi:secondary thiamine-phosphate synthase enzyme